LNYDIQTSPNSKQIPNFQHELRRCVDCKILARVDGYIRCSTCEVLYQSKIKNTIKLMDSELCPNCNVEIGDHKEYGLKECLYTLRGYNLKSQNLSNVRGK